MTAVSEIRLPQFGMGMQEGTIINWCKREGDHVAAGEVVAEIEAEKVTEELVATGGGVIQRILVPEGETVAVNELLAVIGPAGGVGPDGVKERQEAVDQERGATAVPAPVADHPTAAPAAAGSRRQVAPRARRLATELGVDLDSVVGTGPGGRVTEDDITAAAGA